MRPNDNVVIGEFHTKLDIPADRVLDNAKLDPSLDTVVVIGKDQDGHLYFASSTGDLGEVFLLFKRAEQHCIEVLRGEVGGI